MRCRKRRRTPTIRCCGGGGQYTLAQAEFAQQLREKILNGIDGPQSIATLVTSITFLAYPGEGFSTNWIRLVQGLMVSVVLVFMIFTIVPLYRKVIGLSASGILQGCTDHWDLSWLIFQ